MKKLTTRKMQELKQAIGQRDGKYCFVCQSPGSLETLWLDFWDCNTANRDLQNLHLLCRVCLLAKSPWLRRKGEHDVPSNNNMYVCVSENERTDELPQTKSLELLKNMEGEPAFKRWLFPEMVRRRTILLKEALDSGAAIARLSQETVKRYASKETCPVRPYMITYIHGKRYIQFKPEFESFRKVVEERRKGNADESAIVDKAIENVQGVVRSDDRKKQKQSSNAASQQTREEKPESPSDA